ncbi:MAG: hypothetical protein WCA43_20845, partial [Bradyrhizobium sp.]
MVRNCAPENPLCRWNAWRNGFRVRANARPGMTVGRESVALPTVIASETKQSSFFVIPGRERSKRAMVRNCAPENP